MQLLFAIACIILFQMFRSSQQMRIYTYPGIQMLPNKEYAAEKNVSQDNIVIIFTYICAQAQGKKFANPFIVKAYVKISED
jgi:hypothetical protein